MYSATVAGPISYESPRSRDAECKRCPHSEKTKNVCLTPELSSIGSEDRTILIVGEAPGRTEDSTNRPMSGTAGHWLREQVKRHWRGKVAFDYALRCVPSTPNVTGEHLAACRGFLAKTAISAQPERILAFGKQAVQSLLGRSVTILSARKGFGWYLDPTSLDEDELRWVPVFILSSPTLALKNRFTAHDLAEDITHALTTPLPTFDLSNQSVRRVESLADAHEAHRACADAELFAFDTETSGRMHDVGFLVDAITLWPSRSAVGYLFDSALNNPQVCGVLREILTDNGIAKVGHNVKYDMTACLSDARISVMPTGIVSDTRLARKLLEPTINAGLEVAAELVGQGGHKAEADALIDTIKLDLQKLANEGALTKSGKARKPPTLSVLKHGDVSAAHLSLIQQEIMKPIGVAYHYLDSDVRGRYNARDAASTMALHDHVYPKLAASPGQLAIHDEVSISATKALAYVEHWGFAADRDTLNVFTAHLEGLLIQANAELTAFGNINWASTQQVGKLFYEQMSLPVLEKTESGMPSTDAAVLELLAEKHPVARALLNHRKLTKLHGTYAEGLSTHIRADGRVHPSFLIDGAETGRISSANPNLQNLPSPDRDPVFGKMCRDIFYAPDGYSILEGDMSQQEIRVAAMVSGDTTLISELSTPGVDIHRKTAALVYKIAEDDVSPTQRTNAKTVVFGLIYGKTDHGLSKQLGISLGEAKAIRDVVLGRFKQLALWIKQQIQFVREHGGVWSWWNGHAQARWRPLYGVAAQGDDAEGLKFHAENAAVNGPIQGPAADFVTASLWPLVSWILRERIPAKVVCSVHDSILVEVRDDFVLTLAKKMHQIMCSHNSGNVLLLPDFKIGQRWGSLTKYKIAA